MPKAEPKTPVYRDFKPVSVRCREVGYMVREGVGFKSSVGPGTTGEEIVRLCKAASEFDAERIAACINACRNVPTHQLENGPTMQELLETRGGK